MTVGFFTPTELLKLKLMTDKDKINTDRILDLIKEDLKSDKKAQMLEGVKYYDAEHDIEKKLKYYYVEGVKIQDLISANYTISHPYHKVLVDQKQAYMVGDPISIGIDLEDVVDPENITPEEQTGMDEAEEYLAVLDKHNPPDFNDIVNNWIKGASNKAEEWVHFYIDADGNLRVIIVPAEQLIPVYDTQYQHKLVYMIRYYMYDYIDASMNTTQKYKVEWWTDTFVEYFVQIADDTFIHDPDYEINPAGHWRFYNKLTPKIKVEQNWTKPPFVPVYNNSEGTNDLKAIKLLVDAYDVVKSDWLNDIDDFQELVYILKGYSPLTSDAQKGMSELAIFLQNLKAHKVISLDTEAGSGVDTLKAEIPIEARKEFLKTTRNEIFYFGEGVDIDSDRFGNNPSGVSLKFLYGSLDLKAKRSYRKLEIALKEYMWFLTYWINFVEKKEYDSEQLSYTFNKTLIFNEKEKVELLSISKGQISDITILENHPLVTDPKKEMKRLELQKEKEAEKQAELFANVETEEDEDDDD